MKKKLIEYNLRTYTVIRTESNKRTTINFQRKPFLLYIRTHKQSNDTIRQDTILETKVMYG